ncbi:hypothetical protein GCM10017764_14440 [Sphingobacterium griseoflavum]|uniref:Type 9 secretion system plug protein N-terminal domain-containing protein n=1 Tax=Sphingobacterium griseoflavum TaxID=1474952 RepID=A0ABQ3HT86_9SPHI|nr:hypothetical protein GCM10017764_14440 [Sphingobacterium griseoflavum]
MQLYPEGEENEFPVYQIGGNSKLLLSFDDLRGDVRNYYFCIVHCNEDWTPSRATILDYVDGFNEDRINDFMPSKGTIQPYTRYTLAFPSATLKPKLAGNYILQVYEDGDKERLLLTRRFYVLNDLVKITAAIQPSLNVHKRPHNQKLNIDLSTALTIPNPQRDLTVYVLQNQRPDRTLKLRQPNFFNTNLFRYNNAETLDFEGGSEFRFVDLRSFRTASERVQSLQTSDSTIIVHLYTDNDQQQNSYASTFDENGRFYIRNQDFNDQTVDSDYAIVHFSLKTEKKVTGNIYIVGGFNNYTRTAENKLQYDQTRDCWTTALKLKQGLYDYTYVLEEPDKKAVTDAFSGSYFDTGNDYQILIYNRRIGTYWDELVGYRTIGINNRKQ